MDPENPGHENLPLQPLGTLMSVPYSVKSFSSSGPLESLDSTSFRPAMSINCETTIFSSASPAGHNSPSFRTVQLGRNYGPAIPPPPFLNASSAVFMGKPQQPFMAQEPPACSFSVVQTLLPPPLRPPTGSFLTSTAPFHGNSQVNSMPDQIQPQKITTLPLRIDKLGSSIASFFSWGPASMPTPAPVESAYSAVTVPLKQSFPTFSCEQINAVARSETAATSSACQVGYSLPATKLSGPCIF